jgi:hypothetical protein
MLTDEIGGLYILTYAPICDYACLGRPSWAVVFGSYAGDWINYNGGLAPRLNRSN